MFFSQMFCKTEYFEKYGKETFLKCLFLIQLDKPSIYAGLRGVDKDM